MHLEVVKRLPSLPQVLGASLGGTAAAYANNGYENLLIPSVNTDDHTYFAAVAAEIIVSAFLVLTVLSAGTSEKVAGNSYFGLAIGFVVLGGVVAVGDIVPGSTFNPAVGMVLPVIADRHADDIWVCLVGDTIGAFIAVALYAFWRDVLKKPEAIDRGQSKYFRDDEESNNYNIKSPLLQ